MAQKRTITITFHATDEELARAREELDSMVDRIIYGEMSFLSGRAFNLLRMLRGQVAVASGYIKPEDYEETVKVCRLDSGKIDQ